MYKNNFYKLLVGSLILTSSSHVQVVAQHDKAKWKHLDERVLTSTTIAALERWHTDSLGCLKLRKWDDGQLLIKRFKLENADKDSVAKVLGDPSFIVDAEEFTTWTYFIHRDCSHLMAEPARSLSLKISLETNKVIEVSLAVH